MNIGMPWTGCGTGDVGYPAENAYFGVRKRLMNR
jgi:hypothetical protein